MSQPPSFSAASLTRVSAATGSATSPCTRTPEAPAVSITDKVSSPIVNGNFLDAFLRQLHGNLPSNSARTSRDQSGLKLKLHREPPAGAWLPVSLSFRWKAAR